MTIFELKDRNFEQNPQWHQPYTKFHFTVEEVFVTLYTADVEMSTSHFIIDPIFNRNTGNTFHHQNGPNQPQQLHKTTGPYLEWTQQATLFFFKNLKGLIDQ